MAGRVVLSSAGRAISAPPRGVLRKEDARRRSRSYAWLVLRAALRRLRSTDALVALGFVVAAGIEAVVRHRHDSAQLLTSLPGALVFGCLALRRSRPLLAMTVLATISVASSIAQAVVAPYASGDATVPIFALILASYSLGAHASRRQLFLGAPQPVLVVLAVDLAHPGRNPLPGAMVFVVIFIALAPILAGRLVRARTRVIRTLRAQAAQLDARRRAEIHAAVLSERLRMADRFRSTLLAGLRDLAARADAAGRGSTQDGPTIEAIEASARQLLSQTREEVIALTAPAMEESAAESDAGVGTTGEQPATAMRMRAQRWTVLAGGALGAGLLVETQTLPVAVPIPIAWLACIAVAVPIVFAWLRPLPMIVAAWVAAALFSATVASLHSSITAVGLSFVAPFTVAALEPRGRAVAGLLACWSGQLVCFGIGQLPGDGAVALCCWIAGMVFNERTRLVEQLRANNVALADQHTVAARRAVVEERLRAARELHDAVGHSLTVIALQASAARRIQAADPSRAHAVLATIASVANDGLDELQRDVRRAGAVAGPTRAPRSIDDLLAGARAAGLVVSADIEEPTPLGASARLTAYRIIQEALTNILKHAPGASAEVTMRRDGPRVDIIVSNTATGATTPSSTGGRHGLQGMRLRVEACGGQISWQRRDDDGFEVCAHLPVEPVVL